MGWEGRERRMSTEGERIAVLEQRMRAQEDGTTAILTELRGIRDEMTRYKGFMGGVAFIASGMAILAGLFKEWVLDHVLH